jgi:hypothetical protein
MIEKLITRLSGLHPMSEALTEKIITITKIKTFSKNNDFIERRRCK